MTSSFWGYLGTVSQRQYRQDIEVRIKTTTPEMLHLELVDSTIEYLERLVGSIDDVPGFGAGPDQRPGRSYPIFLKGWIISARHWSLLNFNFDRDQFNQMLLELMQAMELQDIVTVADPLSYEWNGWLENVLDTITLQVIEELKKCHGSLYQRNIEYFQKNNQDILEQIKEKRLAAGIILTPLG